MEHDQRILDIIAAASEGRPAAVTEPFNELVGERIAELVAQRKDDLSANFFGDPVAPSEEPEVAEVHEEETETPEGEALNDEEDSTQDA